MKYDVVIIGAGVMGAATAYHVSKRGKKVLLVDQFSVVNEVNSSIDYSRVFRYEYGNDEYYTNLAVDSLKLWHEAERDSDRQLFFPCGTLLLENLEEGKYAKDAYDTLLRLGHSATFYNTAELRQKYPQFRATYGVMDNNGGFIDAQTAVSTFAELTKRNGGEIVENIRVEKIDKDSVKLQSGETIACEKLIVTAGVWTNELLEAKLPLQATWQELVYFQPKNPTNFRKDVFPVFGYMDYEGGFYGFPIHGIEAVKVSNHIPGAPVEYNEVQRKVSKDFIDACRNFLSESIPELTDAEIVKTKVCFYNMTPDGDFIVDRLEENIIVGTGFSGHGFKFAPLIGKILADLAIEGGTRYDISRFRLRR